MEKQACSCDVRLFPLRSELPGGGICHRNSFVGRDGKRRNPCSFSAFPPVQKANGIVMLHGEQAAANQARFEK